jgi:putative endonuclease
MIAWFYKAADLLRSRTRGYPLGRRGEDLAHRHLRANGCTVVARNFRTHEGAGEIDLVARDGEQLVFVEVKTRSTTGFGEPDRAVDAHKRERIRRAASQYARRAGVDWSGTRFDIISVVLDHPVRIEWIQDAFR